MTLAPPANITADSDASARALPPSFEFSNITHVGALKELAIIYDEGDGLPHNPILAYQLIDKASELGDPEAQSEIGYRLATGAHTLDPPSGSEFVLGQCLGLDW